VAPIRGSCALLVWLMLSGCSGRSTHTSADEAASAGGAANADPQMSCATTPRTADDELVNTSALDLAAHAKQGALVPVMIALVEVEYPAGAKEAERTQQLEPYQAPLVKSLAALGAQNVERFWLVNAVSASVPAASIDDILCLPDVVRIDVEANYWDVVEPPWGADEAGSLECPLVGDECPEHCFDFMGVPLDANAGCYGGKERVGCAKTTAGIDDGAASCRKKIATGKPYLFYSFIPVEPNFIGWTDCNADDANPQCP
jgi:hypothetical protein